ncbi:MAG: PIN domain-containing protein [Verrucomicrobiae bacterium]|nr:PIN domain-containing protein [Verrucomicrobiae bacterium]
MTHLMDSSAFFAYFFNEPGRVRVEEILRNTTHSPGLSILTATEFWACLKRQGNSAAFEQEWQEHRPLFDEVVPVDWAVTHQGILLREAVRTRLPAMDALIAATAVVRDAVLVHRDPHFLEIPPSLMRQEYLG